MQIGWHLNAIAMPGLRWNPFGAVGFEKPVHATKWPGQRLVLCHYLGMRYTTGGGCLGYPFTVDVEGYREVIKGHSFKLKNLFFRDTAPLAVVSLPGVPVQSLHSHGMDLAGMFSVISERFCTHRDQMQLHLILV